MATKQETELAVALITRLLASSLVTDKASALVIIDMMKDMVNKGF